MRWTVWGETLLLFLKTLFFFITPYGELTEHSAYSAMLLLVTSVHVVAADAYVGTICVGFYHFLFHRHNILYGDLKATDEQVLNASKMAELHQTITTWPSGYDTQVTKLDTTKTSLMVLLMFLSVF